MASAFHQLIGTAWGKISPAPASLSAGLAGVQAYVVPLTNQPVSWQAVKRIARTSSTGDWGRVIARSQQTPNLPPSTSTDSAILAAKNAVSMLDSDTVDPTNAASGGPTGTGTSIADNTVTWTYLGPVGDMNLDNTAISTSQVMTVSTFTVTMPGA